MCRLLGMVANRATDLTFSLLESPNSLRKQAKPHPDGWGIAAFQCGRWQHVRAPLPADEDEESARRTRDLVGSLFISHVRNASRGSRVLVNTGATVTHEKRPNKPKKKRRHVKHAWPELGTILEADYHGVHYEAEVIAAPRLKSGKAVRILTGPSAGDVCRSLSGAMLKASEMQRQEGRLGKKGVANGWSFWPIEGDSG